MSHRIQGCKDLRSATSTSSKIYNNCISYQPPRGLQPHRLRSRPDTPTNLVLQIHTEIQDPPLPRDNPIAATLLRINFGSVTPPRPNLKSAIDPAASRIKTHTDVGDPISQRECKLQQNKVEQRRNFEHAGSVPKNYTEDGDPPHNTFRSDSRTEKGNTAGGDLIGGRQNPKDTSTNKISNLRDPRHKQKTQTALREIMPTHADPENINTEKTSKLEQQPAKSWTQPEIGGSESKHANRCAQQQSSQELQETAPSQASRTEVSTKSKANQELITTPTYTDII